jgi:hypothetical protein
MMCFRDRTWCASPECQGECGRKMTPEILSEAKKSPFPISWGMFCGGGDYPEHGDVRRAMGDDN